MDSVIRRRKVLPDVPEDISIEEHLAHLNDPNYPIDEVDRQEWYDDDDLESQKSPTRDTRYTYGEKTLDYSDLDSTSYSRSSSRIATSRAPFNTADEEVDESPYPEVRASVPSVDDPSIPCNTFRTWSIGLVLSILIAGLNQFFSTRGPSIYITPIVIQLIALPIGKAFERVLPSHQFKWKVPFINKEYTWSFNPGPFNVKEHTLITVMANVSAGGAYATDVILAQRINTGFNNIGYALLLCLSSQVMGFAVAGFLRPFLIWPPAMLWPASLVNCTLLTTLHKTYATKETKHISRQRFFLYVFLAGFCYYFLPGYLFTALSVFNWVCWIAPQNPVVNALFGTNTGLGMGLLTFDWSMISWFGSPLMTPWWAEANVLAGLVIFYWIICPILYFKNALYAKFMPISSPTGYDNTGNVYDFSRVIGSDGRFDEEAYLEYSPLYLPTTFAVAYGLQFALFTSSIVHIGLWYGKDILRRFKLSLRDEKDIHCRLMAAYPEVPLWWYIALGLSSFVLGIVAIEVYNTQLPIWAYVIAIALAAVYMIPAGIIVAVSNQYVALNVISEAIGGALLPGRPVAVMIMKAYSQNTLGQALAFSGDLKLGHYMKIPPRLMFLTQVASTLVVVFVVNGVQEWQLANIPGLCTPDQVNNFFCPQLETFNTAGTIWGGIGVSRIFGHGALYYPFVWFFIIGAVLPIPFYLAARRWPTSMFKFINIPVIFSICTYIPPASGINVISWALVGFVFQSWIRKRHFRWWMRFNYILSAGLDAGVALGIVIIFFALQLPKGGINLDWWGNNVWINTLDAQGVPFITLAANETFGPKVGEFH
ncbi:hypothetical protein M422DRAFT_207611 [Sphaerobolus stellatus SS14]|uniref:Glutathione transporter n=1 Tax=Sphaerobolus stellatus (strain SS14) TaxID=990650 RepID=A0A0C9UQP7_SPHS4|nr:hypothetical protein M422DRAFT_207611 [Sphaerobolus stellatus SS14]